MIQLESGYFVPASNYGNRFFAELETRTKLPTYNLELIEKCLEVTKGRRGTVLDVGAYLGSWTLRLATQGFEYVMAFEPIPDNFACLRKNVDHLNLVNVTCVQTALLDYVGECSISQFRSDKPYAWAVGDRGHKNQLSAECTTIDSLNLSQVDMIKIRTNGSEHRILRGALQTLHRRKPFVLVCENYDPQRTACTMLRRQGMKQLWSHQRTYLFGW